MPEGIDDAKNKTQRVRIDRSVEQGSPYATERGPSAIE